MEGKSGKTKRNVKSDGTDHEQPKKRAKVKHLANALENQVLQDSQTGSLADLMAEINGHSDLKKPDINSNEVKKIMEQKPTIQPNSWTLGVNASVVIGRQKREELMDKKEVIGASAPFSLKKKLLITYLSPPSLLLFDLSRSQASGKQETTWLLPPNTKISCRGIQTANAIFIVTQHKTIQSWLLSDLEMANSRTKTFPNHIYRLIDMKIDDYVIVVHLNGRIEIVDIRLDTLASFENQTPLGEVKWVRYSSRKRVTNGEARTPLFTVTLRGKSYWFNVFEVRRSDKKITGITLIASVALPCPKQQTVSQGEKHDSIISITYVVDIIVIHWSSGNIERKTFTLGVNTEQTKLRFSFNSSSMLPFSLVPLPAKQQGSILRGSVDSFLYLIFPSDSPKLLVIDMIYWTIVFSATIPTFSPSFCASTVSFSAGLVAVILQNEVVMYHIDIVPSLATSLGFLNKSETVSKIDLPAAGTFNLNNFLRSCNSNGPAQNGVQEIKVDETKWKESFTAQAEKIDSLITEYSNLNNPIDIMTLHKFLKHQPSDNNLSSKFFVQIGTRVIEEKNWKALAILVSAGLTGLILPSLFPTLIANHQIGLIAVALDNQADLGDRDIFLLIRFCFAPASQDLLLSYFRDVKRDANSKSGTRQVVTNPVVARNHFLNRIIRKPVNDIYMVQLLKNLILEEITGLLNYLLLWLKRYGSNLPLLQSNKSNRFSKYMQAHTPQLQQIIHWTSMMLDAHHKKSLLNDDIFNLIMEINQHVQSQVQFCESAKLIQGLLENCQNVRKTSQRRGVMSGVPDYSVELLKL